MTGRLEDGGRGGEPLARLVACFSRRPLDGGGWLSLRGRGKGVGDGRGRWVRRPEDGEESSDDWWIRVVTGGWEIICSTSFGGDPGTGKGGCLSGQGEGSWGWLWRLEDGGEEYGRLVDLSNYWWSRGRWR
jgi:hypothetical protein